MINIGHAKLDPGSVFKHPQEVLTAEDISRDDKIDILRRWAYDERELQVAEEENMPSVRPTDNLNAIIEALHSLGVELSN